MAATDYAPVTLLAKAGDRTVLLVEVHPGLAAVDRPRLMAEVGLRMRSVRAESAVVVTPFMSYLVADSIVVASRQDGRPALTFRYGSFAGEGAIWDHFLGATALLWRLADLGPVDEGAGLAAQAQRWLASVVTYGSRVLRPLARAGIGLAHALLLVSVTKLREGTIVRTEGLLRTAQQPPTPPPAKGPPVVGEWRKSRKRKKEQDGNAAKTDRSSA